jgi:hypothetical protein
MLATIRFPSDKMPIILTKIGKAKATGYFLETNHLQPTGQCNGFPVYNVEILEGEAKETCKEVVVHKTKRGWQYASGVPVDMGRAIYFRNYAD